MKTSRPLTLAAGLLAAALSPVGATDRMLLPVGKWNICFANGANETCEIRPDGTVTVTEPARTSSGKVTVNGSWLEIRYDDDRTERWMIDDDWLMVKHWFRASAVAASRPVNGVALRPPAETGANRPPVWNDRISSVRVGRNVRITAWENTGFEGASIVLNGTTGDDKPAAALADFNTRTTGLTDSATWNDRISSLRIVRASERPADDPAEDKVVFFSDANFEELAIEFPADSEAADLALVGLSTVPMKVHEWGTFTLLQGSDGNPIEWYQAPEKLIDLPPFVGRVLIPNVAGKYGTSQRTLLAKMDTIRMETPVLYFYPDKERNVTVAASFPQGRITEVFPPATGTITGETIWNGRLLPPDSPERSKVPAATGKTGRHYAAARAVPDAWLFRAHQAAQGNQLLANILREQNLRQPAPATVAGVEAKLTERLRRLAQNADPGALLPDGKPATVVSPIDHFIFYRGAGNRGGFEIRVVESDRPDTFTLTNSAASAISRLLAIKVKGGLTSWVTVDQLPPTKYVEGKAQNQQTMTFPAPAGAATAVAATLRTVMIESLIAEGLTKDEAAAMVATWDDLWFIEPGTRILALLPRQFADAMVPLSIIPPPAELDRIFVARVEIITRAQEQILAGLLTAPAASHDPKTASDQFDALHLGRYAAGAMERAAILVNRSMRERFQALNSGNAKLTAAQRTGP